jgi:hypothetical protein
LQTIEALGVHEEHGSATNVTVASLGKIGVDYNSIFPVVNCICESFLIQADLRCVR